MKESAFYIQQIPAILYGREGDKAYLFVHGRHASKTEAKAFAEIACPQGWQVLSVDLPGHGTRVGEGDAFVPWYVVPELQAVMAFARLRWTSVALRADSIGAWFSLLAFQDEPLENCLFVSPVLDMEHLIQNMIQWAGVTEESLRERETIETTFGETLSWRYYQYAKEHEIKRWPHPTAILYAGRDNLTERGVVDTFSARFGCTITVMEDGEHWFHTGEQRKILQQWTQEQLAARRRMKRN